jgi:hypothetical protein
VCFFLADFVVTWVSREKDRIDEQKEQAEADLQDALARL